MIPSHNAVGSADTVLMVATVDTSFDVGQNLISVLSLRSSHGRRRLCTFLTKMIILCFNFMECLVIVGSSFKLC